MNYQTYFVCFFLLLAILMKLLAYFVEVSQKRKSDFRFVFLSPLFSTKSYQSLRDQSLHSKRFFIKTILTGTSMVLYFWLCSLIKSEVSEIGFSYICAFGIYLLTLTMGSLFQLIFSLTKISFVDIHDRPYLSFSLTDFWSKRWNRWIRDWLNNLTYKFKFSNLAVSVLISFLISGIFHEIMFNLPFYLYTGKNAFGNMMVFFTLQGLGIIFERYFLRHAPVIYRRIFMWVMVIGLCPLFIREPLLSVIGLTE